MSDSGLKRSFETDTLRRKSVQMEPSALPQPNTNKSSSLGLISSQSSGKVEDFLNNKLDIPFIVGDHVLVSGLKEGIVRFIGQADFAKGVWVGVELKKAMGKNDGSVAGKRYFQCPAMHGLFAPVHKVEVCKTPARAPPQPRSRLNLGVSSVSKSHRGSSIKSATSSASRRMKLGVTSLTGHRPKEIHSTPTLSSYQKKMLKLKEEEDRVTQFKKIQRDLGVPQFIKNEEQFNKRDNKYELIKSENNRSVADLESEIRQLEEKIRTIEGEKNDMKIQLMEEQRKKEDILFSLEQNKIKMNRRFEELDTEEPIDSEYWDENAELKYKLCVAESKLKIYENGQMDHEAGNQIKNFEQKVEKVAVEFASRVKSLEWRAETAENDAEDLRDKLKHLKKMIHEISEVKHFIIKRDLNAEIEKLKNAMQEDKKESQNEESQDVGLMSIGIGASLIESQIDFLNADLESRLKIAESSKSMTDIDGTGQKPATVRLTCDVLDLHDTDDCPMRNTTSSPHDASLHHGNRDEERPYCSSCKVSGHSTDQCNDDQKY